MTMIRYTLSGTLECLCDSTGKADMRCSMKIQQPSRAHNIHAKIGIASKFCGKQIIWQCSYTLQIYVQFYLLKNLVTMLQKSSNPSI